MAQSSRTWIINPASHEENRGSFCYLPYYLYAAKRVEEKEVFFLEDFTIAQKEILDHIKPDDEVYVSVWSYPQLELARLLCTRIKQALFFGYTPMIESLKLPVYRVTEKQLLTGMKCYAFFVADYQYLLLSDCDGHLKDKPEVYPFCSSYGCQKNCSFCPVTPNLDHGKIVLPVEDVLAALSFYRNLTPDLGVHFTDEDFFSDPERAKTILEKNAFFSKETPSIIALGNVRTFTKFLDLFENDEEAFAFCKETGLYLVEIGMETADKDLAKHMGKPSFEHCERLAERVKGAPVKILWLSLTYSPGETVTSLRATGKFLKKHGLNPEEMDPRIRTNGTEGGLGQFFQLYEGTRDFEEAGESGWIMTETPSRLIPSYVPYSFLRCKIQKTRTWTYKEKEDWLGLYNAPVIPLPDEPIMIIDYWESLLKLGYNFKALYALAIAARLGVIEEVE